jgi:hypothetical protein
MAYRNWSANGLGEAFTVGVDCQSSVFASATSNAVRICQDRIWAGAVGGRPCGCPTGLCHAIERAVLAEGIGFTVLNLMSENPGMRWDIETTKRTIGYEPQDGAAPVMTEAIEQDERVALDLRRTVERLDAILQERRW